VCTSDDEDQINAFDGLINLLVTYDRVTEEELVINNVIKGTVTRQCIPTTTEACFNFDSETGTIIKYYEHENNDIYQSACPKDVIIPSKIDGVKVKKIADCAFTEDDIDTCDFYTSGIGLTSVVIQEGIEEIGFQAFYRNEITSVKLPNSLVLIGMGAFRYNNQIKGELDLSNLTKLTTIENSAFSNNQIASVKLPANITEIHSQAFAGNQIKGELDLSGLTKLTTIESYAFNENQITSVKLPPNLEKISDNAFEKSATSNPNLTTIINPSGNSFDWYEITLQGTSGTCTFATGTCGTITISAS